MMKKNLFLYFLVMAMGMTHTGYAQQISLSKDSLYFPFDFSYDTLMVSNTGGEDLLIDSIFSIHEIMAYNLEVQAKDTTFFYTIDGGHRPFHLTIAPSDSARFIFKAPDLCAICKAPSTKEYFEDSLSLMSNSLSGDSLTIFSYGQGHPSGLAGYGDNMPQNFLLWQNYPNPFNPKTRIGYQVSSAVWVNLSVYNALGQKVAALVSGKKPAGKHSVIWNAAGMTSGVYICKLTVNGVRVRTIKMVLIR